MLTATEPATAPIAVPATPGRALRSVPAPPAWRLRAKRLLDVLLATTILVATLPVLLLIALAIRLDTSGPALYRQRRVGYRGETFTIFKFRTMHVGAETQLEALRGRNDADGVLFKIHGDPRVTRVGRFLRRTSLDELPQIVNVLSGVMSLVGPRPALPDEVARWAPEVHARLGVKPGITGPWQISGRSALGFDEYVRLDLHYVSTWTIRDDLAILLRTVPAVLLGRGAY